MKNETIEASEDESLAVKKAIEDAIGHLIEFRAQEGLMLQKLFTQKIGNIAHLLTEVAPFEKERTEKIKSRIIDHYGQGKKLGFISQEIGREVNTMGSKANHAELQKIVVRMKDELEQIKEQILNVM